jgi:hypothetical protein
VRAKLVSRAEFWEFSSCGEYYGFRKNNILTLEIVQNQIGTAKDYKKFIEEYEPQDKEKIAKYLFT